MYIHIYISIYIGGFLKWEGTPNHPQFDPVLKSMVTTGGPVSQLPLHLIRSPWRGLCQSASSRHASLPDHLGPSAPKVVYTHRSTVFKSQAYIYIYN